jgi:hypothetical protein
MVKKLTPESLVERLADGAVVPLGAKEWTAVADHFHLVDAIDTHLAGRILLVRRPCPGKKEPAWAIVEEPSPSQRVIRPLKNEKEARALIADRLAAYERMWDG